MVGRRPQNILFVMCDQLRADYLGCYGHRAIRTPVVDGLAAAGVSFSRAYVQSPVCGPSRMSFYTGRYVATHGSTWNDVPLPIGELTLGDHLRPLGADVVLIGKTHMATDWAGMERALLDLTSDAATFISQAGFEPFERDDGLHPDQLVDPNLRYNQYLRSRGYPGANGWHEHANSARGPDGALLSGWYLRNAGLPADIREADSETPYMVDRLIEFLEERRGRPWLAHLSFIKPHWPYIAPAPYHAMYGREDVQPVHRDERERREPHPVYAAYMRRDEAVNFSRDEVRELVVPTYMGLTSQIDTHLARVLAALEDLGMRERTMIVFTSDHGDYLGDHWLGDKELFHEASARIPLIIVDPSPQADATRGTVVDRLVEAVDLAPTFIEAMGGTPPDHILEGRSLLPLLHGRTPAGWRDAAVSELDYSFRRQRLELGLAPREARAMMIRTERYKYIHYETFRPQLFDLHDDPDEFVDLGEDPGLEPVRREMRDRLFDWLRRSRRRTTLSEEAVEKRTDMAGKRGFLIGVW